MRKKCFFLRSALLLALVAIPLAAQDAAVVGTVRDAQQAVIPDATVTLDQSGYRRRPDHEDRRGGDYEFPFVKPGNYSLKAEQKGFETFVQGAIRRGRRSRARVDRDDARRRGGDAGDGRRVGRRSADRVVESGRGGESKRIAEMPLNGRFFLDLALLATGTTVPSTNNRTFLAVPSGIGISGINASGTREDSTNYVFDGINLSDMAQNQITFQPNIDMIQEFKVLTNAFSAEYGRNAGIIINGVSKSGTNGFHGTGYRVSAQPAVRRQEFLRSRRARSFPSTAMFTDIASAVRSSRTARSSSRAMRGGEGHEVASLKTPVPTVAQRAAVTNPVVQKLLALIPAANDPTGTFFVGPTPRNRHLNQFTGRIDHNFSAKDFLFGSFISNRDSRTEPTLQGKQSARIRRLAAGQARVAVARLHARVLAARDQ